MRLRPSTISETVKILIVDDNPLDIEVTAAELRCGSFVAEFASARDEAELRRSMSTFDADVILCDFSFPQFDGLQAVAVVREYNADVPVIFVSGTIDEDRAVIALQSGAVDYVLKTNVTRLASAVQRAVHDARESKRLRGSVILAELRQHRKSERLDALWRIANEPGLHGDALLIAMLCEAANALRSPQPFGGILTRSEENDVVVLVTTPQDEDGRGRVPEIGTRMPLSATLAARGGRTQTWNISTDGGNPPAAAAKFGWRCAITTTFEAGAHHYHLTFASLEPLTRSFAAESIEYVELLGSAFATRIRLTELELSLRDAEGRSTFRLHRIERLYRLTTGPNVREHDVRLTVLQEAAVSIRPDLIFRTALSRIENRTIVEELVVEPDAGGLDDDSAIARESALIDEIVNAEGGTYTTDVLLAHAFTAGATTLLLTFHHTEPLSDAFEPHDLLYVQMLGTFLARASTTPDSRSLPA